MKQLKFKIIGMLFIATLLGLNSNLFAQRGYGYQAGNRTQQFNNQERGNFCNAIPDLTEDQQKSLQDFRTAHLKEMQEGRNKLAEKRARLQTLRTSDNTDMSAINKTIDEMSAIRAEMQKERENHFQDVRSILTEEQRVHFDSRRGRGAGYGKAYGRGQGRGFGRGGCVRY